MKQQTMKRIMKKTMKRINRKLVDYSDSSDDDYIDRDCIDNDYIILLK